ncbi:hypothetical protein HPB50_012099 [Hyalomma asiaticum]|uniref:Uncharacterized protein n=1 Tax=Hyalomma asiaticum TaxID=266040 RepID=A0ACB7SE12_HYAAI|nr:hypothetical protein HPB50_012099 [Hyalomma asiaticum]
MRNSLAKDSEMHLKIILVGLTIFGLIVEQSGATPASSASDAEARVDPEPAHGSAERSVEVARIDVGAITTEDASEAESRTYPDGVQRVRLSDGEQARIGTDCLKSPCR